MVPLLISLGVLIAAGGIIAHLPGNASRSTMIGAIVLGALVAASSLFFIF
jgi:hypothetical protein